MKTRKRILSLGLVLALCLGLAPLTATAADEDFVIEDGVLVKYNGPGGEVVVPEGVTKIGDFAFYGCHDLTGITIPNSVTAIGEETFGFCDSLQIVNILVA